MQALLHPCYQRLCPFCAARDAVCPLCRAPIASRTLVPLLEGAILTVTVADDNDEEEDTAAQVKASMRCM